jgi:uncharacterized protein (TIGR02996 family)
VTQIMTPADAFLEDILQHPADDTPRLIFADWLEEQNDPASRARAAFIRGSCRLTQLPLDAPARLALEDECADLLAEYGDEWTAPVRGIARRWEFCRGFIERIEIDDEPFLKHASALFQRLPVRAVRLRGRSELTALARCPQLARVETLDLSGNALNDGRLQPLFGSPYLQRLTGLSLASNLIETPTIAALKQENFLARLRWLDLGNNCGLADGGVRLLVGSPDAAGLEVLRLGMTNITAAGVQAVFAASLPRLGVLHIGARHNPTLGVDAAVQLFRALACSPLLPRLVGLDLSGWSGLASLERTLVPVLQATRLSSLYLRWLDDSQIHALAELPQLSSLRSLDLMVGRMDANGVRSLAQSPYLANLTTLDLSQNPVGDQGAKALASSPYLHRLTHLVLRNTEIGGPGVKALAQASGLKQLRWLDLAGSSLDAASVTGLVSSPHLKHLTTLDLGDCGLRADSVRTLARSSQLTRLQRLFLDRNNLGDKGIAALAEAPSLERLEQLNLSDTGLGKNGAEALAASTHLPRLRRLRVGPLADDQVNLLRLRFGSLE